MGEISGSIPGLNANTYGGGLTPISAGWADWNAPPWMAGSNAGALTGGTIYGFKMPTAGLFGAALTKVGFIVGVVGVTLSGSKLGVYDIPTGTTTGTGTKLQEASADAAFLGSSWQEVSISVAAASLTPYVYIALLPIGTTGPQLVRTPNGTGSQFAMGKTNTNQLSSCLLGGLTGQSALPATVSYVNNSNGQFLAPIAIA